MHLSELPFASINNEELIQLLQLDRLNMCSRIIDYFHDLNFDPLAILDDKYNNNTDLDVNNFYKQTRNLNVPESEYMFIDSLSSTNVNATFSILSLNIRSIPTNLQQFADTVLACSNIHFDVLGFSETRLDSELALIYQLPGYHLYTKCRNRNGGGVALYITNVHHSSMVTEFSHTDPSIECLGVNILIMNKSYLVIYIYRPPSGNMNYFFDKLTNSTISQQ